MMRTERSLLFLFSLFLGPLLCGTFSQQAAAESRLAVTPISVNFGSVPVNTLSSSQAITLLNTGNRNIEILQATSSVPQFAISGPTLPVSVAPGQGVSFLVVFTPNAAVKFSGSINFSIQGRDGSRRVPVSGTGLAPTPPPPGPVPEISLSVASLNLGSVLVGSTSSLSVLLTNNGTADLSISQVSAQGTGFAATGLALPVTVPVGQSASLAVSFSPLTAGSATGSVTVLSNAANTPSARIALSGAGTAQTLQLSPSASNLNFGNILVGTTSSSSAVTFTNTGNTSVSISQVKLTGSAFTASGIPVPSSLAPGQMATLMVSFDPSVTGAATGSVSVVSNATNSPASIGLAGSGVQPKLSLQPGNVAFGNVPVGSTNTQTMTISNPGSATLNISQSSLSGAGFSITGLTLPLNVAPATMSSFTLSYTPGGAGTVSGTLRVVSNAPGSPANFVLSGSGVAQTSQLSASPVSLSFASTAVGSSSASQTVTLSNTGNAAVTISQLNFSGAPFSITGLSLPLNLAAGQITNFSVLFAPLTTGTLSGSASVISTATNSPTTITLSGVATQAVSHSVSLTWIDTSTNLAGFNVYRGATTGGPYSKITSSLVPTAAYTDTSVQSGTTYYYVSTAVDTTGAESPYSNESEAAIP
jgi:hypothetical protein